MRSRLITAAVVIAVLCATGGILAPAVLGSANQVSIIQDSVQMLDAPAQTMSTFRALGVRTVRIIVVWAQIAPSAQSRTAPRGFHASDPSSYPAANWAPYDEMVELAHQNGLGVDLTLSGGAPRWAEGPGIPAAALDNQFWAWRPSASAFGQFARAAGARYSGTYVPPGQTTPLPRVNFWAIWNEPNFGEDLGPQAVNGSTVSVAPGMYRALAAQMWTALQATGHGHDTILIGETAPMGLSGAANRTHPQGLPGDFGQTKPLQFLRTLYCLDSSYRELRGRVARAVGCPTTAAASRRFRAQNPALFNATGYADHPYPGNEPPNTETSTDPDIATFPRIPMLEHELDRIQRIYGSGKRFPIYSTEYGYITHPPNHSAYVSPSIAAYYINWAEYLSWKQPRVASTMQYLLNDPPLTAALLRGDGGFTSGLLFANGKPKPTYAAYRLPLLLPVTSARRNRSLEVWGCVRPARDAILGVAGPPGAPGGTSQTGPTGQAPPNGQPQTARIQFARGSSGSFTTLRTVTISSPNSCYFDVRMRFPGSGTVRLAYTYPNNPLLLFPPSVEGATVYSRSVAIKLR